MEAQLALTAAFVPQRGQRRRTKVQNKRHIDLGTTRKAKKKTDSI